MKVTALHQIRRRARPVPDLLEAVEQLAAEWQPGLFGALRVLGPQVLPAARSWAADTEHPLFDAAAHLLAEHGEEQDIPLILAALDRLTDEWCGHDRLTEGLARILTGSPSASQADLRATLIRRLRRLTIASPHSYERGSYLRSLLLLDPDKTSERAAVSSPRLSSRTSGCWPLSTPRSQTRRNAGCSRYATTLLRKHPCVRPQPRVSTGTKPVHTARCSQPGTSAGRLPWFGRSRSRGAEREQNRDYGPARVLGLSSTPASDFRRSGRRSPRYGSRGRMEQFETAGQPARRWASQSTAVDWSVSKGPKWLSSALLPLGRLIGS